MKILYPIRKGVWTQGYDDCLLCDVYKSLGLKSHAGIDIASFHGDKVFLSEPGTCYKVWDEIAPTIGSVTHGFGVNVLTDPDENGVCREYVYWHMRSTIQVIEGGYYPQGTVLGEEGASGLVYYNGQPVPDSEKGKPPYCGTHLHWGYRKVQRTKDSTTYPNTDFLNWVNGKKYQDQEGYFYKVLNFDNGNRGFLDPMKLDIIYYPEWITKQVADKAVKVAEVITTLPNEIEGVPELKKQTSGFLSILLSFLKKFL